MARTAASRRSPAPDFALATAPAAHPEGWTILYMPFDDWAGRGKRLLPILKFRGRRVHPDVRDGMSYDRRHVRDAVLHESVQAFVDHVGNRATSEAVLRYMLKWGIIEL